MPSCLIFLPSMPMSAIQCWPQLLGQPVTLQPELLIELRQPLFQFVHQPARKALGLGDGQLAELGAGAGNRAAPEDRAIDLQADLAQFACKFRCFMVGNIDEDKILRDGGAQRAAAKALGQLGSSLQLIAAHAAAQHRCSHVAQARLALRMNAGMIAVDVVGHNAPARPGSSVKSSRDCNSARKLSAVQPSFRKRYFMRA